jgi:AcrR family transcriptional regulator
MDERLANMNEADQPSRRKITEAAAEVFAEKGYPEATDEDIAARAAISVDRLQGIFPGKEAAFLSILEIAEAELFERFDDGCAGSGEDSTERIEFGLRSVLGWVDERPPLARTCLLECNRATPTVYRRRARILERFGALLKVNHPPLPNAPEIYEELLVGGICEMLSMRVVKGELDRAVDLTPELTELLVRSYM